MTAHRSPREVTTNVLRFLVHLTMGTVGILIMSAVLTYSVLLPLHQVFPFLGARTVHWILTETPYFPVQIMVGLLCGFQLGRRYRHSAMLWIWSVPALAIILLMLFAPLTPVVISGVEITKAEHFFGWGCLPQNHCFEQVGLTLPFYAASAYSLGGLFARIIPLSNPAKPTDVLPQTAR